MYTNDLCLHISRLQKPNPCTLYLRMAHAKGLVTSNAHVQHESPIFSGLKDMAKVQVFLAHLSRRLKWAIVIAHRPSSVRPSSVVCRPSSVNFHIFNFFSRTAWWILMKLGRDEVLMVPYKCCCFSAWSAKGRIQGGAKIGHRGSPSSRNFFFRPEGYSNKPNG